MLEKILAVVILGGLMFAFYWFGTEDRRRKKKMDKAMNDAIMGELPENEFKGFPVIDKDKE